MRIWPVMLTFPPVGWSKPEIRLSSVVLPHPDGPTMATNSPCAISSEKPRNTSTVPNDLLTFSSLRGLVFISPPHARNFCQLHENPINGDANDADHDHTCDQQIHAQAVARVPDRKPQPVAARDHLC